MIRLVIPQSLFRELSHKLSQSSPRENGAFLLSHQYSGERGNLIIVVRGVVEPDEASWEHQGEHSLQPSSGYINRAAMIADSQGCGLLFVHTHPNSMHPPSFSSIDEDTNSRLLPNLAEILPGRPVGSLVISRRGLFGVALDGDRVAAIASTRISGVTSYSFTTGNSGASGVMSQTFDRQVRAVGHRVQTELGNATITIVGAGGTGSIAATQLARMGVKKIQLIDMDVVEASNLSRIYGAMRGDLGKPKVRVLKRHLEDIAETEVKAVVADVTKSDVRKVLAESDFILGCTDNLASRAFLNDISLQYCIPLVDVGCRILLSSHGDIDQAVVKVQIVTPDSACLWCTGTLEGKAILQESLSPEEKRKLTDEGYYQPAEQQPSVVSITSLAASIAVNKVLSILGVFGMEYSTRTQMEIKAEFMVNDSPPIRSECVCSLRRGVGDSRVIAFPCVHQRRS